MISSKINLASSNSFASLFVDFSAAAAET